MSIFSLLNMSGYQFWKGECAKILSTVLAVFYYLSQKYYSYFLWKIYVYSNVPKISFLLILMFSLRSFVFRACKASPHVPKWNPHAYLMSMKSVPKTIFYDINRTFIMDKFWEQIFCGEGGGDSGIFWND